MRAARGFTLVELVLVITIIAIIASVVGLLIAGPVRAYDAQSKRGRLTDEADGVLRTLAREVRRALPNSVRITTSGSVSALELIESLDAVRYRSSGALGDPAAELDFSAADDAFGTLGKFADITRPLTTSAYRLAIYNVGLPGADAYESANVITPAGMNLTIQDGPAGEDRITLASPFRFAYASPANRVFLVTGPVSYLCDPVSRTLRRYSGYAPAALQADRDSHAELVAAGASTGLLAERIAACAMSYSPGTAHRAGLVSLALTVEEVTDGNGQRERLLHQVHVENAP